MNRKNFVSQSGGGMAIIFLGLSITILILLIFVSIADYGLYSFKRNMISHSIDYAVCAAIQEIDSSRSTSGLANGYDEATGRVLVDDIFLNENTADSAFFSTLYANSKLRQNDILPYTTIVLANPTSEGMDYIIKKDGARMEGSITYPSELETVINNSINQLYGTADNTKDSHIIYVNGNLKTNTFKKVPYYMVFIKDFEIDGLFRKRPATFVGFAGAKIYRKF